MVTISPLQVRFSEDLVTTEPFWLNGFHRDNDDDAQKKVTNGYQEANWDRDDSGYRKWNDEQQERSDISQSLLNASAFMANIKYEHSKVENEDENDADTIPISEAFAKFRQLDRRADSEKHLRVNVDAATTGRSWNAKTSAVSVVKTNDPKAKAVEVEENREETVSISDNFVKFRQMDHQADFENHISRNDANGSSLHESPSVLPTTIVADERPKAAEDEFTNREDTLPISDAFTKFRQLERGDFDDPWRGERKPVRKITPPREEPRYFVDKMKPSSEQSDTTLEEPKKSIQSSNSMQITFTAELAPKNEPSHLSNGSASAGKAKQVNTVLRGSHPSKTEELVATSYKQNTGDQVWRLEDAVDSVEDAGEVPPPGFIKSILSHWKTIEQHAYEKDVRPSPSSAKRSSSVLNVSSPLNHTAWSANPDLSSLTLMTPINGKVNVDVAQMEKQQLKGEKKEETNDDTLRLVRNVTTRPTKTTARMAKKSHGPSLAFTQTRLAKFRFLEAQYTTNPNEVITPQKKASDNYQ